MGPFEVAALFVIGITFSRCFSAWTAAKKGNVDHEKIRELEQRIHELEAAQTVKALQERVQTLEEIVVSEEFELKKKFRQLEE